MCGEPLTIIVLRCSDEVEQSGLAGDGPWLEDLVQPEGIALLSQMHGVVQEDMAVEDTDVSLQERSRCRTGVQNLLYTLL